MSAAGDVDTSKDAEKEAPQPAGGELLYCGATNWDIIGIKSSSAASNLTSPTRLRSLIGIDIRFVASGCVSCHCVALDAEGRCYTWGRNKKGQLGHGDTNTHRLPTIVSHLSEYKIVKASTGRNHTVVVTEDGKSFSFGMNKQGQLGTGSTKNETEPYPVPCLVSQATNAICGGDFTVWLSSLEDSSILTAGLSQYGQLGHGTDNQYNASQSTVKLYYEPQARPRAISEFSGKNVVKVACGTNHTVAVDSNGFLYTWGFGGFGRLGHREQKDEWKPRLVEVFQKHNILPPTAIISAGSVSSACTAGGGQLYMWGKLKNSGDDWMYPKPLMDLSGWNIRCMDSGNMNHIVGADDSCISWGSSQYGELGYGPLGQKSSAMPKKIDILDGMHVSSVASGWGLSLIVVDKTSCGGRLEELEIYEGEAREEGLEGTSSPTNSKKNDKASKGKSGKGKSGKVVNDGSATKKRKKSDDSKDSEDENHEHNEHSNGGFEAKKVKRGGKTSSKGRGAGGGGSKTSSRGGGAGGSGGSKTSSSGRGAKKPVVEVQSPKRGRGRPTKSDRSSRSR